VKAFLHDWVAFFIDPEKIVSRASQVDSSIVSAIIESTGYATFVQQRNEYLLHEI